MEEVNAKNEKLSKELHDALLVLSDTHIKTPVDAVRELISRGHSPLRSEKLYLFIEMAFGRVLIKRLANVVFDDSYIVESADGKVTQYSFADDEYFDHAFHLAYGFIENIDQGNARDVVLAIGGRSAELSAFCKAKESGEDVEGAVFQPLRFSSSLPASDWKSFS